MFDVGDLAKLAIEDIRSESGTLTDPTKLVLTIESPAGVKTTLEYGVDADVIKVSTGSYKYILELTETGLWHYKWEASGNVQLVEAGTIYVPASDFAYATLDDVRARNVGRPITASSNPSIDQVVQFLEETAGVLDGLLRERGYSVPISPTAASSAFKTIKGFNAIGAWALVESSAKTSDRRKEAVAMWQEAQKMLRDGVIELDAPIDTQESLPRGGFSSATPAFFSRDMEL